MPLLHPLLAWPVRFAATTFDLRVTVLATETLTTPVLTIDRNYWTIGDAQADADGGIGGVGDLLAILKTTLQTHSNIVSCDVTLTAGFRVRVQITNPPAQTLNILWDDGATNLDKAVFGFSTDSGIGDPVTGDRMPMGIWRPQRPIGRDSRERAPHIGGQVSTLSGDYRTTHIAEGKKTRDLPFIHLPQARILEEYADTTEPFGAFESAWNDALVLGRRFRVYADELNLATNAYTIYKTRGTSNPMQRSGVYPVFWDVDLRAVRGD